jgi:hypothetical protein
VSADLFQLEAKQIRGRLKHQQTLGGFQNLIAIILRLESDNSGCNADFTGDFIECEWRNVSFPAKPFFQIACRCKKLGTECPTRSLLSSPGRSYEPRAIVVA